jgi:acetyltransferase
VTVRHLDHLLRPASVAVIGASDRPGSLGGIVMRNLVEAGFAGPLWPVNVRPQHVAGRATWPDVASLPETPALAVICTPAPTVPGLIAQLGQRGTRAAVVLSAGLHARSEDGQTLEARMLQAARPHLLRVLGPNCVGLLVPVLGLNASFAHVSPRIGHLAFLSQSGALTTAMLDWAESHQIGFSHFVSMGDCADVDFGDMLDYLAGDPQTHAILMYMESVKAPRKFLSAARAAARNKPVLVVKAGRAPAGARAAASHTGALAGGDDVFDAAVRRAGVLRVDTLQELFSAAETLARARAPRGDRLAILTNGGGVGVLAADAIALGGGRLAELSGATLQALDAVLPATWSRANPVDIIGDAPVQRYADALHVLLQAPECDGLLFMHAPTAIVPATQIATACAAPLARSGKTVLTAWVGAAAVAEAARVCKAQGLPAYDTPEQAAAAWLALVAHGRAREALLQTPASVPSQWTRDLPAARAIVQRAIAAGRDMLDEQDAKQLLAAYGIPVASTRFAADAAAAVRLADEIGYPVALKIVSPQISHKSDAGGVALDLGSAGEVAVAAAAMHARVATARPDATLAGFSVQTMVKRPRAHELIVGVATDAVFGPVVLFGQGGTAVELIGDRAVALPPLNTVLARDLVARTRVGRLLDGYRDRPAIDHAALEEVMLKVSQMVCDLGEVAEIDINPLLADEHGVIALDARVKLAPGAAADGRARLAIRPYPAELQTTLSLRDGRRVLARPIRPEDEPALRRLYEQASQEDMRLRFFAQRGVPGHGELARYSQIDYDREMTFVAFDTRDDAAATLLGYACALADADNEQAEFAVQVATDLKGMGLGWALMACLIDYLRARGTRRLVGECLGENVAMAQLASRLGFEIRRTDEHVALALALAQVAGASPMSAGG